MKDERVLMAFLVAIAVALALTMLFLPIRAKAAFQPTTYAVMVNTGMCWMNGTKPVPCTEAEKAHLKWVNALDATTTPAAATTTRTGAVAIKSVKSVEITREEQIAQLRALIKQLQELLAQLKK